MATKTRYPDYSAKKRNYILEINIPIHKHFLALGLFKVHLLLCLLDDY